LQNQTDAVTCFCVLLYLDKMIYGRVCNRIPSISYEAEAGSLLSNLFTTLCSRVHFRTWKLRKPII